MRQAKGIASIPSIRTAISIPRFLTSRYFRKEVLDPMDYYDAAVYNTPFEDQEIAKKIAYEILFPSEHKPRKKLENKEKKAVDTSSNLSGLNKIFQELNDAGFDDVLGVMDKDVDKLDEVLLAQQDAWDYLDTMIQSTDPQQQARLKLLELLKSEYAIIEHHLISSDLIDNYIRQQVAYQAGNWSARIFSPAAKLGMMEQFLRQSQMLWETAAAMAMTNHPDYKKFMNEILDQAQPISLGMTLNFLNKINKPPSQQWIDQAFGRISSMKEYYELLKGMGSYRPPPRKIIEQGGKYDIRNSLDIAGKILQQFDQNLGDDLFQIFKQYNTQPSLKQVQDATYDDDAWENMLKQAVTRSKNTILKQKKQSLIHQDLTALSKIIANHKSPRLNQQMKRIQTNLANNIATKSMDSITHKDQFLSELDHLINEGIRPNYNPTVKAGKKLGIFEEQIAEFFNQPIKILQSYIENNINQIQKYDRIVRKLHQQNSSIPVNLMQEMMQQAIQSDNTTAMSALGACDFGAAIQVVQGKQMPSGENATGILANALDKSIGGGENLIKQWFMHRKKIPAVIRDKLKLMIREALLEIGMEWANRGTGSTEEGIIPNNQTRPYRPGDELDSIDIEATLETLLMAGKKLDQITEMELIVNETSKGKTSLGVLIDISGSMSGKDLAMCAISVVMLLGKLESKEVAVAMFESNTHVIKGFLHDVELDDVADQLLDLEARGGTRIDAALRWITKEFDDVNDSDVKILYLLSDFMISEKQPQLTKLCNPLVSQGVKLLAAYHGHYSKNMLEHMINIIGGTSMKIKKFRDLPAVISEAIAQIDGR